jgi:hypothetical protein
MACLICCIHYAITNNCLNILYFISAYTTKGKGKVIPLQAYVAQRVGRGIALIFHDRGTRRG